MEIIRNRKPKRLKEYDYSNAAYYFITICIKNREELLGKIEDEKMILNNYGIIANQFWLEIPNHFPYCLIDEFIIMPNHIHGILIIDNVNWNNHGCSLHNNYNGTVGNNDRCSQLTELNPKNRNMELIPRIISQFKSSVTREIRKLFDDYNFGWQKSFFDHIIRNDDSLMNIRHYIKYNPLNWHDDENNLKLSINGNKNK